MAHGEDLRKVTHDCEFAEAVMKAPLEVDVPPVDAALLRFAEKLTRRPGDMSLEDTNALRAQGLTDRAVHDAVQVVALFNYYNRIADGLGVVPADDDAPS